MKAIQRLHIAKLAALAVFLLAILTPSSLVAQNSIPPEALKLLDSSMTLLDMKRCDLSMPWGISAADRLIMPQVSQMFTTPLTAFDRTKFYAEKLKSLDGTNIDNFSHELLPSLGLGNFTPGYYESVLNARQFDEVLSAKSDSLAGFVGSVTLQRFAAPLLPALNAINKSRTKMLQEEILVKLCDSLLMMSSDDEKANLYELKEGEERALKQAKEFYVAAALIDADRLYSAGMSLYRTYLNLIEPGKDALSLMRDSIHTVIIQTKYGKIALGGNGDDVYDGDYILILDIGGNDRYNLPKYDKYSAIAHPLRVIIDLGGNDMYSGGNFSLGGAVFGVSLLFDTAGDDIYSAENFSLGSGLFGVGILHDFSGNDRYIGKLCTQGSAAFGIGLLIDNAGNDSYTAEAQSQGFGSVRGFGAIADHSGNDIYTACSPFQDFLRYDAHYVSFTQGASLGYRPIAAGGIGILADFLGNDTYISDIYGQGTAYWLGLGALYDESGDDRYQAYQYAQGAGVHFGFGILWDVKGEDVYVSHGVSQGCGHDVAMGVLLDEEGNDMYNADGLSLGGGNANAISLFLDLRGNDCYIARNATNTMGFSDFRRNYGMIGIFADGGGRDQYGEFTRNNSNSWKSTFGLFLDAELNPAIEHPSTEPALTPPDDQKEPLRSTLDSLFIQASAAPQKFQYNVEPARNAIIEQGSATLPFLKAKFSSDSPRERLALEVILPKLWSKDSAAVEAAILDSLASNDIATFGICALTAGHKKCAAAIPLFISRLQSDDWRIAAIAAQQLGEIGDKTAVAALQPHLAGYEPMVRARSAFSLGQILPDSAITLLKPAVYDSLQLVRNSAVQGLLRHSTLPFTILRDIFSEHFTPEARRRLVVLLAKADTADTASINVLALLITRQSKTLREYIYRSALNKTMSLPPQLSSLLYNIEVEKDARLAALLAGNEPPQKTELSNKKTTKMKKDK